MARASRILRRQLKKGEYFKTQEKHLLSDLPELLKQSRAMIAKPIDESAGDSAIAASGPKTVAKVWASSRGLSGSW